MAFGTFPGENGRIAFSSGRDGNAEIYVMNADGSEQTRLTNDTGVDLTPSWSPDGTKIAFASRGDIYVINAVDGRDGTNLSNNPHSEGSPYWGTAELEEDIMPLCLQPPRTL